MKTIVTYIDVIVLLSVKYYPLRNRKYCTVNPSGFYSQLQKHILFVYRLDLKYFNAIVANYWTFLWGK